VHAALCADGVAADLYHGKSRAAERHAAQEAFVDGSTRVKVATNAFGMGIDKVDGRFVWHYQLPASLDAYSEESGRAGRDCQPADCLLLYARRDQAVQNFSLGGQPTTLADLDCVLAALPADGTASAAQLQRASHLPAGKVSAVLACCSARATHPRARRWRHGLAARRAVGRAGGRAGGRRTLLQVVQAEHLRHAENQHTLQAWVVYAESRACRWAALTEALRCEATARRYERCDNCMRIAQLHVLNAGALAVSDAPGAWRCRWRRQRPSRWRSRVRSPPTMPSRSGASAPARWSALRPRRSWCAS
jgi:ATP-dependent DNA helicase RecQ